jgi:(1->4)-alpha-D-glucan 1-alpha-D-glucosylmutase
VLAFARGGPDAGGPSVTVATTRPAGLRARGGWADTALPLPASAGGWVDVLTGASFGPGDLLLGDVTRALPVALLVPEGS